MASERRRGSGDVWPYSDLTDGPWLQTRDLNFSLFYTFYGCFLRFYGHGPRVGVMASRG